MQTRDLIQSMGPTMEAVLQQRQSPTAQAAKKPDDLEDYRAMERQEALIAEAMKSPTGVPKGFNGTPEQFHQALAQSYLQAFQEFMQSRGRSEVEAQDYASGREEAYQDRFLNWARDKAEIPVIGRNPYGTPVRGRPRN